MNRVLLEILARTLRGRFVRGIRLLRRPKYFLGFLTGILYFGWIIFGSTLGEGSRHGLLPLLRSLDTSPLVLDGVLLAASAASALTIALMWLFVPAQSPLALNAAEIHLLLPAPFSRRQIIQYGILRAQTSILIVSTVFMFVARPSSLHEALTTAFGFWLVLTLWDLHAKGRNLAKCRVRDLPGWRGYAERALLRTAPALLGGALVLGLLDLGRQLWPFLAVQRADTVDPGSVLARIGELGGASWLSILLIPFRWGLGPIIMRTEGTFVDTWLPALLLLFLHHEWVVRSQARFEDETLERERRRATARSRKRAGIRGLSIAGRVRHPFPLGAVGRPEVAIVWKNLLVAPRLGRRQTFLVLLAAPFAAFALTVVARGIKPVVIVQSVLAAQVFLLGPFFTAFAWPRTMASDLRRNVEVLRTWPLEAWRLVAAEIAAPVAAAGWTSVLGLAWLLGVRAGLHYLGESTSLDGLPTGFTERLGLPEPIALVAIGLAISAVLTAVAAVLATIHAVGALLFPGWVLMMHQQGGGPLAVGHGLLAGLATVLVLGVALIPAVVTGGLLAGLHLATGWPFGPVDIPLFALAAVLPLLVEMHFLVRLGGNLWTRLDPSREILER